MTAEPEPSFRQALAWATAPAHHALHGHPWISSLLAPDLTPARYRLILTAYHGIYAVIEAERAVSGVYPDLSLAPKIRALRHDITGLGGQTHACHTPRWQPDLAVLGKLYVLHGSGFGGQTQAAKVAIALPGAPTSFLAQGTPTDLWRALLAALQAVHASPAGRGMVTEAATATFGWFGSFVSQVCDAATQRTRRRCKPIRPAATHSSPMPRPNTQS